MPCKTIREKVYSSAPFPKKAMPRRRSFDRTVCAPDDKRAGHSAAPPFLFCRLGRTSVYFSSAFGLRKRQYSRRSKLPVKLSNNSKP